MEPILDETSLLPSDHCLPSVRIRILADALKAIEDLGVPRVLRSVQDAADRDIGKGKGLRFWCFDQETDPDSGRFVAIRLSKQPFIDGHNGLFSLVEGERAIEGTVNGGKVFGLALAAINDSFAILLASRPHSSITAVTANVSLLYLDEENSFEECVSVQCLTDSGDVIAHRDWIRERVNESLTTGLSIVDRAPDVFPRLRFCQGAREQIMDLTGSERFFRQLVRHLRALDQGVLEWNPGTQYSPAGSLSWSPESEATLTHRRYGPMRKFPVPDGYKNEKWSHHTKLTGNDCFRLYFRFEPSDSIPVVLIGYFGPHLPTTDYPT